MKIKKHITYILISIIFVSAPTLSLINSYIDVELIKSNLSIIKWVEKFQFVAVMVVFSFSWIYAFYLSKKENSYKLHDKAGIIGVFLAFISLSIMAFMQEFPLFILFVISGFLCIYCISVPVYLWFKSLLRNSNWEYAFLIAVIGSSSLFILDGYASIMINEFFGFNAKYFSFTKPIAMFLILTPFVALSSFFGIVFLIISEAKNEKIEKSSNSVEEKEKENLKNKWFNNFYKVTSLTACYVLLVLSISLGSRSSWILETVSAKFDFDPKASCILDVSYDGYIVLDSAYSRVLTYTSGKEDKYKVIDCQLLK